MPFWLVSPRPSAEPCACSETVAFANIADVGAPFKYGFPNQQSDWQADERDAEKADLELGLLELILTFDHRVRS